MTAGLAQKQTRLQSKEVGLRPRSRAKRSVMSDHHQPSGAQPGPRAPYPERRTDPVSRFFGGSPLWVLVKLALLSVLVGVVLAVFGLDLVGLVYWAQDLFYAFFDNIYDAGATILRWFLLGAVIVFPLWLLSRLFDMGSRRRR
jgi:hypothetical protein